MSTKTKQKKTATKTHLYGVLGVAFLLAIDPRTDVWTPSTAMDTALAGFKVEPSARAAKLRGLQQAGVISLRTAKGDPKRTLEARLTDKGRKLRNSLRLLAAAT